MSAINIEIILISLSMIANLLAIVKFSMRIESRLTRMETIIQISLPNGSCRNAKN